MKSTTATATARFALELPIASRSVSMPIPSVAQVVDGVERPVERREEPDVEDLHDHEHAQHRSRGHGQYATRGGGQQDGHCDDDEELEREPRERAEGEAARLVRRDERGPDEQQGEDRERHADGRLSGPRRADRRHT